jgi:Fe-S oxidoreductase
MATYKAEFFSHYYRRRRRPLHAYALGLIRWEAQLAAHVPRLANTLLGVEPFASLGKRLVGVAQERQPPRFAEQTFRQWFSQHRQVRPLLDPARIGHQPQRDPPRRVVLFPDTFNDYFHPEVAVAATEVLEAAGFEVVVPQMNLCCGRPLYDYGMLRLARRQLHRILEALRGEIQAGTPVVALEPSCGAVLRHELTDMLPHDEFAKRLSRQALSIGEFLSEQAADWQAPRLERSGLVHFHCHQRATSDVDCDRAVLDRLGLDYQVLDDGCCGLAGSFGYERGEHYEVSIRAGERKLLPAVREAADHTLLITDGFSCRSQIEHGSPRSSLHLAQVVQMALQDGPNGPSSRHPEDRYQRVNG